MDILGLLLFGSLAGMTGTVVFLAERAHRNFVTRIRTEWTRSGQIVKYNPVGAFYYGSMPRRKYSKLAYGALGISGDNLVFEAYRKRNSSFFVRLEAVRWLGIRTIPTFEGGSARALMIHTYDYGLWRVRAFVSDEILGMASELSRLTDLPLHQLGSEREDYGPARATRLTQDIYGEWEGAVNGELYLAPDRLLFRWETGIYLSQIRQVDAFVKGGLNPFGTDLLRIEYEAGDGRLHTVGFLVHNAAKWGRVIQNRTDVPTKIQTGRKKKQT